MDMFNEVDLLTRSGEFVSTVKILPFVFQVEVIAWGDRVFVRREDGKYYEGFAAFALGRVETSRKPRPGEPQTCPRRSEVLGSNVVGEDRWDTDVWRFTDPDEAAKFNKEEAARRNADAQQKGHNSTHYPNLRYWLWPGPGPKPRTCSYCGGVHPRDAIRLVKEFGFGFEMTTKGYKLYLEPPGYHAQRQKLLEDIQGGKDPVEAAGEQKIHSIAPPLKVYRQHFTDAEWRELIS